jgi:hypothetical protein
MANIELLFEFSFRPRRHCYGPRPHPDRCKRQKNYLSPPPNPRILSPPASIQVLGQDARAEYLPGYGCQDSAVYVLWRKTTPDGWVSRCLCEDRRAAEGANLFPYRRDVAHWKSRDRCASITVHQVLLQTCFCEQAKPHASGIFLLYLCPAGSLPYFTTKTPSLSSQPPPSTRSTSRAPVFFKQNRWTDFYV